MTFSTEEEAMKKYCPIMDKNCLASRCMMWQKEEKLEVKEGRHDEGHTWSDHQDYVWSTRRVETGRGHCGLIRS